MALNIIKRVIVFVVFTCAVGFALWGLDVLTGNKYDIRENVFYGAEVARARTKKFLQSVRRGWLWSPFLFLFLAISPVFFVFSLLVAVVDCYRVYDVIYTMEGDRFVYKTRPFILDNWNVPKKGFWNGFFSGNPSTVIADATGIFVNGEPIHANWLLKHTLTREQAVKAAFYKYVEIIVGEVSVLRPPTDNPDWVLDSLDDVDE